MTQVPYLNHQGPLRNASVDPVNINKLDASRYAPFNDDVVKYKSSAAVEFPKSQWERVMSTPVFAEVHHLSAP